MTGTLDFQPWPTTTAKIDFSNNQLKSLDGSLPSWVDSIDSYKLSKRFGSTYSCPELFGNKGFLKVDIDASYYDYSGCICDRGYYQTPPFCANIPRYVNYTTGTISDSLYGNNRLMPGISTSWLIRSHSVTIVILIELEESNFDSLDDNLQIFLGNAREDGELLCSWSGFSLQPKGYSVEAISSKFWKVTVLNSVATVQFSSLKFSGNFFKANITNIDNCPVGYEYIPRNIRTCYKKFDLSVGIASLVFAISGVSCSLILCILVVVYTKRNSLVIKSASAPFCFAMLLNLLMLALGSIFYSISPAIDGICDIRPWFTTLFLVGVLSALLVKADRIRKIFNSTELVVQAISNAKLAKLMLSMIFIQIIIMVCYSGIGVMKPKLVVGEGSALNYAVYICQSSGNEDKIWMIIQFVYISAFLIAGIYEAWGVRKVPTAFNEGPHIASCLVSLFMLLGILVPINFLVDDNPNALVVIRGIGQNIISLTMLFFLFGPKIFYIIEGRENDKQLSSIGSKSSTSSNASSSSSSSSK